MYNYAEYDSYHFIKNLVQHDMPEPQAEAIIKSMMAMRNYDISLVASKSDITNVSLELENIKHELIKLELRMIIKLGAMLVAIGAIVTTLIKIIL